MYICIYIKISSFSIALYHIKIYRYSSWPGQATAYKIGQLEILRLRRLAEAELGSKFNLKAFHSLCLNSGSLTLSILADMVANFIDKHR